jgi:RNA polymerase sigma-70 factor, ECF subfamily
MDESAGGDIAWEALYRRLEKPLYNMAYRYVWSSADAQDVVHEAFLALWRRRDLLKAATVDRYLWVATLNAARKRRRWRRLREFVSVGDDLPAAEPSPLARDVERRRFPR